MINDYCTFQFYWIDKSTILFLSNRGTSGHTQIFQLNLPDDVSKVDSFIEPIQITEFPLDVDNLLVNPSLSRRDGDDAKEGE